MVPSFSVLGLRLFLFFFGFLAHHPFSKGSEKGRFCVHLWRGGLGRGLLACGGGRNHNFYKSFRRSPSFLGWAICVHRLQPHLKKLGKSSLFFGFFGEVLDFVCFERQTDPVCPFADFSTCPMFLPIFFTPPFRALSFFLFFLLFLFSLFFVIMGFLSFSFFLHSSFLLCFCFALLLCFLLTRTNWKYYIYKFVLKHPFLSFLSFLCWLCFQFLFDIFCFSYLELWF